MAFSVAVVCLLMSNVLVTVTGKAGKGKGSLICILTHYYTIRQAILRCAQKLTSSQLNLPHGNKQTKE